ncbi:MAG: hypothetical protein RL417_2440 [Pseudomonadota bacterium]|jgi:hypothetical protein
MQDVTALLKQSAGQTGEITFPPPHYLVQCRGSNSSDPAYHGDHRHFV